MVTWLNNQMVSYLDRQYEPRGITPNKKLSWGEGREEMQRLNMRSEVHLHYGVRQQTVHMWPFNFQDSKPLKIKKRYISHLITILQWYNAWWCNITEIRNASTDCPSIYSSCTARNHWKHQAKLLELRHWNFSLKDWTIFCWLGDGTLHR